MIRCIQIRRYSTNRLGFVGLGHMGRHMANRLAEIHSELCVHDMDESQLAGFKQKARSIKDIAQQSSVVFLMLPSSKEVKSVLVEDGLLRNLKPSSIVVNCSTIEPAEEKNFHEAAKSYGVEYLDAPVTGGTRGAQNGSLTFMVGGDQSSLEKVEQFMKLMGQKVFHCGGPGSGQTAKLCNNAVLGLTMLAISEAFHLGIRNELSPTILYEIFASGTAKSWALQYNVPVAIDHVDSPAKKDYQAGFAAGLMFKDLSLALNEMKRSNTPCRFTSLAQQVYHTALQDPGVASKDFSVIYKSMGKDVEK